MRILAGTLLLAGCSPAAMPEIAEDSLIDCAIGEAPMARDCVVERSRVDEALFLTVRHPDGTFRRFEVLSDGTGLAAADGAEQAQVNLADGGIEVLIDGGRYRFPATIRSDAAE